MTLVDLDKVAPVLQVISQGCVLTYGIWWISLHYVKNPPNELLLCSVHCTVYTEWLFRITSAACQIASTSYHECTQSHQLRTMNARGPINSVPGTMNVRSHTNSVPWMHAVCRLRQVTFIQFNQRSFGPIAYIHGTELVWLRSFIVQSWCDLVKWPYGVQNRHKVTLTSQSDFRSY